MRHRYRLRQETKMPHYRIHAVIRTIIIIQFRLKELETQTKLKKAESQEILTKRKMKKKTLKIKILSNSKGKNRK